MRRSLVVLGMVLATACGGEGTPAPKTPAAAQAKEEPGVKLVPVVGGKYKVWTKRYGQGPVKVLVLHGGPGISHDYLEALTEPLTRAGIEVYHYDQLGSGASDKPDDPSLWSIERFLSEVEEVRAGLGLDKLVLYGHSWGTILAIEYALKYGDHLSKLVVSGMTGSVSAYAAYVAKLRKELSPEAQKKLDELEKAGKFEDPEYEKILMGEVYPKHLLRLPQPWPAPVMKSLESLNPKIYGLIQGPNEFVITGTMKTWDRWKDLGKISVPTLAIGAKYDEVDPEDVKKLAAAIPKGKYAYCEKGSHLAMWDDPGAYFGALIPFLTT